MSYLEYCRSVGEEPCYRLRAAYRAWTSAILAYRAYRDVMDITNKVIESDGFITMDFLRWKYWNRTKEEVRAQTVRRIWRDRGMKTYEHPQIGEYTCCKNF